MVIPIKTIGLGLSGDASPIFFDKDLKILNYYNVHTVVHDYALERDDIFSSSVGSFFTQKFKVVQVSLMMTPDLKKVEMMMICRDELDLMTS